jgi:hypothetical protein
MDAFIPLSLTRKSALPPRPHYKYLFVDIYLYAIVLGFFKNYIKKKQIKSQFLNEKHKLYQHPDDKIKRKTRKFL